MKKKHGELQSTLELNENMKLKKKINKIFLGTTFLKQNNQQKKHLEILRTKTNHTF